MKQPDPSEHPTAALRRMHRWRMALSGLMILVAGITLGAAGTVMVMRPTRHADVSPVDWERAAQLQTRRMQEILNLTSDQVQQIRSILNEYFQASEELRRNARPQIDALLENMKVAIDGVLTADQRDRWMEITESLDRFLHRGMMPGRGGGSPRGRGGPSFRGDGRQGPRSFGGRGFDTFDPNGARRSLDGRRDPNSFPPRTFDMWQGRDGQSRSFGRRGGMDGRMIEPNALGRMPIGGPPVDPNHTL